MVLFLFGDMKATTLEIKMHFFVDTDKNGSGIKSLFLEIKAFSKEKSSICVIYRILLTKRIELLIVRQCIEKSLNFVALTISW